MNKTIKLATGLAKAEGIWTWYSLCNLLHVLTLIMCNQADAQYQKKRTRAHQDVVLGRITYSVDTHIQKNYKMIIFLLVTLLI